MGRASRHADASHFWLNEGWTSYIERVLQEKLHSPAHRGFSFLIGYKALQDALKQYEARPKYQRLIIDFEIGEDPDDAYSSVPYEKGANLLLHLGELFRMHYTTVLGDSHASNLQSGSSEGWKPSFLTCGTMSTPSWARASTRTSGKLTSMTTGARTAGRRK